MPSNGLRKSMRLTAGSWGTMVGLVGLASAMAQMDVDAPRPGMDGILVGQTMLPGPALQVFAADGLALVAAGDSGFHILDATDPARVVRLSTYQNGGFLDYVGYSRGHAYVLGLDDSLEIVDVSDPRNPRRLPPYQPPTGSSEKYVWGGRGANYNVTQFRVWDRWLFWIISFPVLCFLWIGRSNR